VRGKERERERGKEKGRERVREREGEGVWNLMSTLHVSLSKQFKFARFKMATIPFLENVLTIRKHS